MGTLEIVLLVLFGVGIVLVLCSILFKKKKKSKKENKDKSKTNSDAKPKVEPAIKKEGKEPEKEEAKEEKKEPEPFKIIRKQSEVKINKKALKGGSRNPSVTQVFKDGKKIDEVEKTENPEKTEDSASVMTDITTQEEVGRYGTREPVFDELNTDKTFQIRPPFRSPNRAPIITDRTNFASHLNVSEDNNLSGVVGTGISKAIEKNEQDDGKIRSKTDELLRNAQRTLFGDDFDPFDAPDFVEEKESVKDRLKGIDMETLIVAEALLKPKNNTKK